MVPTDDMIAALATPAGTSALAVIRISGTDTERLSADLFGSPTPPRSVRRADYRDLRGELLDEVLVTFFRGPKSYTGENSLEISCHGNPFIAQKILEDLLSRGCRCAEPGEFTRRAFLNGRMDLSQAEAVMDVIGARSERALASAHRQLRGSLGRHLQGLADDLLGAIATVEAHIDFPEEDLPPEDKAAILQALASLCERTGRLIATQRYGDMLRDGIRTVIVGEPNAGKSSLLNRLVGRDRAIVSPEPGTTRDFIEERIVVGPHSLRLVDTAGLNPAPGVVERLGIDKTHERIEDADIILLVSDAARPTPPAVAEAARAGGRVIAVLNKIDLLGGAAPAPEFPGVPSVPVSALTGAGIAELTAEIAKAADEFQRTEGEDAVVINARHAHALSQASEGLAAAIGKLEADGPAELVASDLRSVLDAYGQILGKIDNERMLDRLFAAFCIGK